MWVLSLALAAACLPVPSSSQSLSIALELSGLVQPISFDPAVPLLPQADQVLEVLPQLRTMVSRISGNARLRSL
jgi:hypothetical protein